MTDTCIICVYVYKLCSRIHVVVWLVWLTKCERCRNKCSSLNLRQPLEIRLAWLHENCRDRCRFKCLSRWSPDYGENIWTNLLRIWPILISSKPLTLPKFFSRTWHRIHVNWQKRRVEGLILVNWRGSATALGSSGRSWWLGLQYFFFFWFLRRNI